MKNHLKLNHRPIPIIIGSSIWFAHERLSNGGIVEYHPCSDTFAPLIPYPETMGGDRGGTLKFCKFKDDCIVVISFMYGRRRLSVFNTKTREFSAEVPIKVPEDPPAYIIGIGDYIHTIPANSQYPYCICSMTKISLEHADSCQSFRCLYQEPYPRFVSDGAVIKANHCYKSSSKTLVSGFTRYHSDIEIPSVIIGLISEFRKFEVFKFGGVCWNAEDRKSKSLDSFYIGTLENGSAAKPIQWNLAPQFRLKQSVCGFGHIQFGPFIVIFGGRGTDEATFGMKDWSWFDDIYILDLSKSLGWVSSSIKCPRKAMYRAVLDTNQKKSISKTIITLQSTV